MRNVPTARTAAPVLAALMPVALLLAGCSGGEDRAPAPADTITYGSLGTRAGIDCENGKSLTVGGSNNTLSVRGTCRTVTVSGADNRITVERIEDALEVVGLNNTVTVKAGNPAVTDTGTGNRIAKG